MDPNRKLINSKGFSEPSKTPRQTYERMHFDPRKTGRDRYDPSITYGPNYKPTPGAVEDAALDARREALRREKRRFEENKKKKTFKLP